MKPSDQLVSLLTQLYPLIQKPGVSAEQSGRSTTNQLSFIKGKIGTDLSQLLKQPMPCLFDFYQFKDCLVSAKDNSSQFDKNCNKMDYVLDVSLLLTGGMCLALEVAEFNWVAGLPASWSGQFTPESWRLAMFLSNKDPELSAYGDWHANNSRWSSPGELLQTLRSDKSRAFWKVFEQKLWYGENFRRNYVRVLRQHHSERPMFGKPTLEEEIMKLCSKHPPVVSGVKLCQWIIETKIPELASLYLNTEETKECLFNVNTRTNKPLKKPMLVVVVGLTDHQFWVTFGVSNEANIVFASSRSENDLRVINLSTPAELSEVSSKNNNQTHAESSTFFSKILGMFGSNENPHPEIRETRPTQQYVVTQAANPAPEYQRLNPPPQQNHHSNPPQSIQEASQPITLSPAPNLNPNNHPFRIVPLRGSTGQDSPQIQETQSQHQRQQTDTFPQPIHNRSHDFPQSFPVTNSYSSQNSSVFGSGSSQSSTGPGFLSALLKFATGPTIPDQPRQDEPVFLKPSSVPAEEKGGSKSSNSMNYTFSDETVKDPNYPTEPRFKGVPAQTKLLENDLGYNPFKQSAEAAGVLPGWSQPSAGYGLVNVAPPLTNYQQPVRHVQPQPVETQQQSYYDRYLANLRSKSPTQQAPVLAAPQVAGNVWDRRRELGSLPGPPQLVDPIQPSSNGVRSGPYLAMHMSPQTQTAQVPNIWGDPVTQPQQPPTGYITQNIHSQPKEFDLDASMESMLITMHANTRMLQNMDVRKVPGGPPQRFN